MAKSFRQKKLQTLKSLSLSQKRSESLAREQSINILQTKLLEKELTDMKAYLQELEEHRDNLLQNSSDAQPEGEANSGD